MTQTAVEYADWAEEEAPGTLKTWLVPVVEDMDSCIRERFFPRILQEMNDRLVRGDLSQLLGQPVVSGRIRPRDLEITDLAYWRLNRTDFLADLDLSVSLTADQGGRDVPGRFGLCLSLWFCTEEGFSFEVQELHRKEDKPERSFWKLDRYLVPVIRDDEIETGADRLWETCLPDLKDPKERKARLLAESLGLKVVKARLHARNRTRASLFFQAGTVTVQEEKKAGDDLFPSPVPLQVSAGTILLNDAAHTESEDLDILHECIHYDWHLLFYRLQRLASTDPVEIRYRPVQNSLGRPPCDPLRWTEHQARHGSLALLLPRDLMNSKAWRLYQRASAFPSVNGYQNHPGFRWDRVIRRIRDEYGVPRTTIRRRLVQLGHPSALGAVNFVEGQYITPFAFTAEHSSSGRDTLVIGRRDMADLYHRSNDFRELMGNGDFVYADGHICLNDPQFLRTTPEGARLTPWANAHVDACCLRFEKIYLRDDRDPVLVFGRMNSDEEYIRQYNRYLDRQMTLTAKERMARRNQLMEKLPAAFPDALRCLMQDQGSGRVTVEELAARAQLSVRTVERYRSAKNTAYSPDVVVALCIALHLPPWLSRVMLEKAGILVRSYGPRGYYGEILDCCFMDTIPEVQQFLRSSGYPELKLQEA